MLVNERPYLFHIGVIILQYIIFFERLEFERRQPLGVFFFNTPVCIQIHRYERLLNAGTEHLRTEVYLCLDSTHWFLIASRVKAGFIFFHRRQKTSNKLGGASDSLRKLRCYTRDIYG